MRRLAAALLALALLALAPPAAASPPDGMRINFSLSMAYAGAGVGFMIGGVVGQVADPFGEDQATETLVGGLAGAGLGGALAGFVVHAAMGGRDPGYHLLSCGLVGLTGTVLALRAGRYQDLYDPEPAFFGYLIGSAAIGFVGVPITSLIAAVVLGRRDRSSVALVPWVGHGESGAAVAVRW